MNISYFFEQLINGMNTGSIYALVAIGYTMVYGIIRLINFAHGEIMMYGAYFSFVVAVALPAELSFLAVFIISLLATAVLYYYLKKYLLKEYEAESKKYNLMLYGYSALFLVVFTLVSFFLINSVLRFIVILLFSMLMAGILGITIEFLAYRKLRTAPRISALITAIGMSLFLQNLALLQFGANPYVMPQLISKKPLNILGLEISPLTLATITISFAIMALLTFFVKFTKPGKAMRAVSQDKEAALLMGINVNRIITLTFLIGSSLGALGGVFYAMAFTQIAPTMGVLPGLRAFVAAVFGGIGNITGAMIGGYTIGFIEIFAKQSKLLNPWSEAIVFSVLIFVLLFKPSGILGKNVKEKV